MKTCSNELKVLSSKKEREETIILIGDRFFRTKYSKSCSSFPVENEFQISCKKAWSKRSQSICLKLPWGMWSSSMYKNVREAKCENEIIFLLLGSKNHAIWPNLWFSTQFFNMKTCPNVFPFSHHDDCRNLSFALMGDSSLNSKRFKSSFFTLPRLNISNLDVCRPTCLFDV